MDNNLINNLHNIITNDNNDLMNNLYKDMSKYQKKIFDKFKEDTNEFEKYSLNDLLYDFDKEFIETILNIEIDLYLKETQKNGINNKKNGFTKDIDLTVGDRIISFNRPRLRKESDFNSVLIPKRTRIIRDLKDNILLLYSKNNSVNDIKEILKNMFKIDISTAFISKLINEIADDIFAWRNRELKKCYFSINIDCTYITIRDQKYLNSHDIPVYVAIGTTLEGHKEVVGVYFGNEDEEKNIMDDLYDKDIAESKTFWLTVFNDIKDRGVEKVLFVVSDGVSGIKNAIKDEFPETIYQRCVVHIVRNLKDYTNKNNSKEIISDFKKIYQSPSKDIALENKEYFINKYEKNKTLMKHAINYIDEVMPLFNVPINIRNYIYTNNIVESANSKIKRGIYGRGALPNSQSAINIIYFNLIDLEKKWQKSKVRNWNLIFEELMNTRYEEIKQYL